jgi:hypothetical protein
MADLGQAFKAHSEEGTSFATDGKTQDALFVFIFFQIATAKLPATRCCLGFL